MRTRVLIFSLAEICGWAGSLTAQTPAPPAAATHSLSLYVNPGGSGGATKNKANETVKPGGAPLGGGWVSAEEKHFTQKRESEDMINLNVEIRNLAKVPDNAKLEWFFYARNI